MEGCVHRSKTTVPLRSRSQGVPTHVHEMKVARKWEAATWATARRQAGALLLIGAATAAPATALPTLDIHAVAIGLAQSSAPVHLTRIAAAH